MTLPDVRDALERLDCRPRKSGRGLRARCPVCQTDGLEHDPALHVELGDAADIVLFCHAGRCQFQTILTALGLERGTNGKAPRAVLPTRPAARPSSTPEADITAWSDALWRDPERLRYLREIRGLPDAVILAARLGHDGERFTVPVFDADGGVLHVRRYSPDLRPKMLSPQGATAELYGAETLRALEPGALVLVCEGELDVLLCRTLGHVAVSGTAGAGCWRDEWSARLRAFELVLIGDHDEPGRAMVGKVGASARKAGAHVEVVEWPEDEPAGTDPTSYVAAHGADAFRELVEAARSRGRTRFELASAILGRPMPALHPAVEGLLLEREVGLLSGPAGVGKSWCLLSLGLALSTGRPVFGAWRVTRPYRVAFVDLEDGGEHLDRRLHRLAAGLGLGPADLGGLLVLRERVRLDSPTHLDRLLRLVRAEGVEWLLVDSFRRATGGDENASGDTSSLFVSALVPLKDAGCGAILLDHVRKLAGDAALDAPEERLRGSGDKRALADCHVGVERRDERVAWIPTKTRHARLPAPCLLMLDGLDEGDPDDGPVGVRVVGGLDRASDAVQDAVLAALDEHGRPGDRGPELRRGEIVGACSSSGYSRRAIDAALAALRNRGRLASRREGREVVYLRLGGTA